MLSVVERTEKKEKTCLERPKWVFFYAVLCATVLLCAYSIIKTCGGKNTALKNTFDCCFIKSAASVDKTERKSIFIGINMTDIPL